MLCRTTLGLFMGWIAIVASAASVTSAATGEAPFATGWILICLSEKVESVESADDLQRTTGVVEIDRLIVESGVVRIDPALPVSTAPHRSRPAHDLLGLDRTYKFHVREGSDIPALAARFAALPGVDFAEPDFVGQGSAVFPNDPRFDDQYAYDQPSDDDVDGPDGWEIATGATTTIAVLDTGANQDHPDLIGNLVPGYDFVNDDSDPEDDHGHGSNVGAIAAAVGNNGVGMTGACWGCSHMPLKVLDQNNNGFYSNWADAMVYAADSGARVINLSAGGFSASTTLLNGVRYAYDAGVVVVSITHNDDQNSIRYPGRYAETVTVGATDELDRRADPFCYSSSSGSNYGPQIDVVAPGELILGASTGSGYSSWCGTSQAAPLVAGLVGIMRDMNPSLGREEARHLLQSGAEDKVGRPAEDVAGFDQYHGWGRVNMAATLAGVEASMTLRVDDGASTRLYFATPNPLAGSYDFIRGPLGFTETASGVSIGVPICIEDDSADAETVGDEDTGIPVSGGGYYYLARFNAAPGAGSFGGSTRNRDRFPVAGGCN